MEKNDVVPLVDSLFSSFYFVWFQLQFFKMQRDKVRAWKEQERRLIEASLGCESRLTSQ